MEAPVINDKKVSPVVDPNLVSFFDLLAKFDYEDKQKEKILKSPELTVKDNSNGKPAVQDIR